MDKNNDKANAKAAAMVLDDKQHVLYEGCIKSLTRCLDNLASVEIAAYQLKMAHRGDDDDDLRDDAGTLARYVSETLTIGRAALEVLGCVADIDIAAIEKELRTQKAEREATLKQILECIV